MDDFPWILFAVFLLWIFNLLGGRKGAKVERQGRRPEPREPRAEPGALRRDPTQTEGGQLEELLRALEQRLDPTAAPRPPRPPVPAPPPLPRRTGSAAGRGPLGRPASVPLPTAEEVEERESLESDPAVESLEREVRRPERVRADWLAQAEARERARLAQVEARDRESHKSRHTAFDQRIREQPAAAPAARRLTTAEIRQAFIWGEILGRPKGFGGGR